MAFEKLRTIVITAIPKPRLAINAQPLEKVKLG
jgi:hypothetical protein